MNKTNPSYYNRNGISVGSIIKHWGLNFFTGNVLKYLMRAGKKDGESELDDLKKAQCYLDGYISDLENDRKASRPPSRKYTQDMYDKEYNDRNKRLKTIEETKDLE